MTERTQDQITRSLEELQSKGITSWPAAIVALIYKFGWGFGAVVGLVGVLGFASWILWGHMVSQQKEITSVRVEQIADLRKSSEDKTLMVQATTRALSESAEANNKLSKSLDDLTGELRQARYRSTQ